MIGQAAAILRAARGGRTRRRHCRRRHRGTARDGRRGRDAFRIGRLRGLAPPTRAPPLQWQPGAELAPRSAKAREPAPGARRRDGGAPRLRTGAWPRPRARCANLPRACGRRRRRAPHVLLRRARLSPWLRSQRGGDLPPRVGGRRPALAHGPRAHRRSRRATPRRRRGAAHAVPVDAALAACAPGAARAPRAAAKRGGRRGSSAGRRGRSRRRRSGSGLGGFDMTGGRRFTFSTTTALVRPWEKLWRTTPVSGGRCFKCRVFGGETLRVLSPLFSLSLIRFPTPGPFDAQTSWTDLHRPLQRRARPYNRRQLRSPKAAAPLRLRERLRRDNATAGRIFAQKHRIPRPTRALHVSHLSGLKPNPIA